jgi:hypothetical protein
MRVMIAAAEAGDIKAAKWLLEHTAHVAEDGSELRPIAQGIDSRGGASTTPAPDEGPRILIGVALGSDFARLSPSSGQASPTPAIIESQPVSVRKP